MAQVGPLIVICLIYFTSRFFLQAIEIMKTKKKLFGIIFDAE